MLRLDRLLNKPDRKRGHCGYASTLPSCPLSKLPYYEAESRDYRMRMTFGLVTSV